MKYTSMANTIHAILESRSFTPVITDVEEPLEKEEPEDTDTDTSVADMTVNYPPNDHDRIENTGPTHLERVKSHLKHSMRRQHKLKVIDNT